MITIQAYQRKHGIPTDDLDAIGGHYEAPVKIVCVAHLFQ